MRCAIAGAGAMGAMFGGCLARARHEVTLVDTDRAHVDAIGRHGLVLRHRDGTEETIHVTATTDPRRDLGPVGAVIVLRKGWANETVAASKSPVVTPATWVVTVQNGLGNDRRLATVFAQAQVVPGATSMADDFASGRRSEIDSFCVEISRIGVERAVGTPTHDTIGRVLVARLEQGGLG